jgi:hypothetical protein
VFRPPSVLMLPCSLSAKASVRPCMRALVSLTGPNPGGSLYGHRHPIALPHLPAGQPYVRLAQSVVASRVRRCVAIACGLRLRCRPAKLCPVTLCGCGAIGTSWSEPAAYRTRRTAPVALVCSEALRMRCMNERA